MTGQSRLADLMAYVDDCLPASERVAVEARLKSDPASARRVAAWRKQNAAIRSAFDLERAPRPGIDLGRQANENRQRAVTTPARRVGDAVARPGLPAASEIDWRIAAESEGSSFGSRLRSWARVSALALGMICAVPSASPGAGVLVGPGLAAYRAFAAPSAPAVEFATHDADTLRKWLATRFARPIAPPTPANAQLTLIGARLAPATGSVAVLLIYESPDRRRLGLLVSPMDAPEAAAPALSERGGLSAAIWTGVRQGYALVGDAPPERLAGYARAIFAGSPD